jgi:hypothetical protein
MNITQGCDADFCGRLHRSDGGDGYIARRYGQSIVLCRDAIIISDALEPLI